MFPDTFTRPIEHVGIGFKHRYADDLLVEPRPLGWLEIHAENYMVDGGPKRSLLEALAARYPISCHGVGLSIGADAPLDAEHLSRLARLQDWLQPALFSEHLAWSSHGRNHYNDLLPLPCNDDTLERVVEHLLQLQDVLGRQVLLENPSSYLAFDSSTRGEPEFIAEVARRSGCGLLLDVSNVYVSACNLGFDAHEYLARFALDAVREIHLAGHRIDDPANESRVLIDSHDTPIVDPVWELYRWVLARTGPLPTLIERDADLPSFPVLLAEAEAAARCLGGDARDRAA